jgi:hypothetical protein
MWQSLYSCGAMCICIKEEQRISIYKGYLFPQPNPNQYQQCSPFPQHYFLPFSTNIKKVATYTQEIKLFLLNIYRKFQGNFPFMPTHWRNISSGICIYFSFFRTDGFPYWISTLSTLIFLTVKHTLILPCVLRLDFFLYLFLHFSTLLHLPTLRFHSLS